MSQGFEVRPLQQYDGARYRSMHAPLGRPAAPADDADTRRPSLLRLLATAVLVLGLSLGLIGCWGDLRGKLTDGFDIITSGDGGPGPDGGPDGGVDDDGGDIIMGEMVECTPGDIQCFDDDTLASCNDSYYFDTASCAEICEARGATTGEWAYSLGCDVDAADPCQCQYDMIDGGMPACMPGDVYCADSSTLVTCDDNYAMTTQSCEEICDARYGDPAATSLGCDDNAADPCQCQYDIVGGVMAECTPGDIQCVDDHTLASCNDSYSYDYQDCDARCAEQGGRSLGCAAAAADPCQCEYDIIDGDVAACTPGDIVCVDNTTAQVCDSNATPTLVSCAEHCRVHYGDGFYSIGCDTQDLDNFCGCKDTVE